MWKEYFDKVGIRVVFWFVLEEIERYEKVAREESEVENILELEFEEDYDEEEEEEEDEEMDDFNNIKNEN